MNIPLIKTSLRPRFSQFILVMGIEVLKESAVWNIFGRAGVRSTAQTVAEPSAGDRPRGPQLQGL
jgi:hypothetical protein